MFDIDRDIDLAHLREIMSKETITNEEYNYYGLYLMNIIKIVLNSHWFRGYPDDLKEDMSTEALIDTIPARLKFDGERYTKPTAPFNYIWRIVYHSCQHVLKNYYLMQHRMVSASRVGQGTRLMDSPVEFTDDILEKAVNDWDAIAENLRG